MSNHRIATRAVHAGESPDAETGALVPPLVTASTFALPDAETMAAIERGDRPGYLYSRLGNPTVRALERKVAALEGAEGAVALASGMAAVSAIVLSTARSGERVLFGADVYGGTQEFVNEVLPRWNIRAEYVDATDPGAVRAALKGEAKLLHVESPSNPTLKVCDLAALAGIAHEAGALLSVDNTFATPVLQRPLELGADIVMHSATKYLCGHGDAIAGVVCSTSERAREIRANGAQRLGGAMNPFAAYLVLRGILTLPVRMAQACENALRLSRFLESRHEVSSVTYPGLDSHPEHSLAGRQMQTAGGPAYGAMLTFDLAGGDVAAAAFCRGTKIASHAVSLGDVRTLVLHYGKLLDEFIGVEARRARGVTDGFVRVSVGIEDIEDLVEDFQQALDGLPARST